MRKIIPFLIVIFALTSPSVSFAQVYTFEITPGISLPRPPVGGVGYVQFVKNFSIQYHGGKVWLSGSSDGTGNMHFADTLQLVRFPSSVFTYNAAPGCLLQSSIPPQDITSYFTLFNLGINSGYVRLIDWCGRTKDIGPLYITEIMPTPTSTPIPTASPPPTPTPTPSGPVPFLDLPWDYESDGLTFSDAALSINAYFDHEYPLLSSGMGEPDLGLNQLTTFLAENSTSKPYSSHDGYDYGSRAKAYINDPVLAAGDGIATFVDTCTPCGNMILIDHENGYQTRYLHLADKGIFDGKEEEAITVTQGQVIGKVGATGNVIPKGEEGAHIHFGLFQDKDGDGSFGNNIPDGVTDPFGWQGAESDPWEVYEFIQHEHPKKGNKSHYLWIKSLDKAQEIVGSEGGEVVAGRNTIRVPSGAFLQDLTFTIQSEPVIKTSETLTSLGPTFSATAKDILGNIVDTFSSPLEVIINFDGWDLSRFDPSTLSIYSSDDGVEWEKENTIVNYFNHTATTHVTHFTHFALMGERVDTIAPTTTAVPQGEEGEENWFRSDVEITLSAEDNTGGLGVDYTLFNLDENDWKEYAGSIVVSEEGNHTIQFYSVDTDENIEDVKRFEFSIDKTPPSVDLRIDQTSIWPPNGKMHPIAIDFHATDTNPHSKSLFLLDEYSDFIPEEIDTIDKTILLQAERKGSDKDGRVYIIRVVAQDWAGNTSSQEKEVRVLHDKGN